MTLGGTSSAWADELTVYNGTGSSTYYPVHGNYADTSGSLSEYIIPSSALSDMTGCTISKMSFYISSVAAAKWTSTFTVYMKEIENSSYESSSAIGDAGATVVYVGVLDGTASTMDVNFTNNYDYNGGNLLIGFKVTTATSVWKSATFVGETQSNYTAFRNKNTATREKFLPKTTFTYSAAAVSGPALIVKDENKTITSPYTYDFGLAEAKTTKVFTLSNPGTAAVEGLSVSKTGSFGATLSATSIAAGGEATLTVTMPDATGSSKITVSSTTDGIADFIINASGTLRDPNKVYLDFADGQMPDGWTWVAIGSYASSYPCSVNEGYISWAQYGGSSYAWAFTSPKLNFEKDELVYFETTKYSNSTYYSPSVTVEYSLDGTTWTAIGSAFTDDEHGTWKKRNVTIPVEGVKYIRFNGWYIQMRNIYGGELPNEPKMVVTQPTSLDYGIADKGATAPTKTFTIANTGKATLEGISVTSGNAAFIVSNAQTTLAAGASQEVTITMSTATTGALSSLITVSATGMEDVEFTVSGVVLPDGLSKEEFTDGLPANWTNTSWTFNNGVATGKSSSAYLTTPKLTFSSGDLIVLKARRSDSDTSDYLTVQGSSDNGSTWTAYSKKLQNADGLTYPDFGTIILSDIPTTVNKLRFVGFYAEIDEIWGLTYAPVLSVTTGDPAVSVTSPAAYDFEECTADATVTYNFANAGAGTINITNVAITGEGAASYSTNWTTSVTTPFALEITRKYDATKAATTQSATVTVTTSEGDFIINVSGKDKAANTPELAVSTNAIDFGKTTTDVVTTVDVTNNGTGSMTVNIFSNSDDFTVSPATLTAIGAGETKSFDVTFKHGEPYGVKNGQIVVMPTYDSSAAVNINVTGKAKDPNVWSEDFSGNTLPTGWEAGADWTIADGVAKGAYAYSSTTYLTTPTLVVSATTDELTFDYAATANYVSIKIQMSKNGAAFTDFQTIPNLNKGDAGTATLTGFEPGNYQFRFKNNDYNLDNFEGFKLNLPDHMASISAYSIPESSSYSVTMKEGQSFDATVTVKELRGVAEELTAKLYMGEEVIGTKTGSVAAKGTETLTITCTPTVAAPEGAQMHIEVEWAGTKMTTENVTRYVAAITYLTLDETSSDAITAGTYDNVTLKRKFNTGWNTVCLPFTISDVEAFFGAGAKAYSFSSYTDGNLGFTTVSTLTASYPYIVYVPAAITDDIVLTNITIASGDKEAWYTYKNGAYFRGTYTPVVAGAWTKTSPDDIIYGVVGATGRIQQAGDNASIKGFRAYFDLPASAPAPSISFEDAATGIKTVITADELNRNGEVYNLNGQKVQNAHKGLYIVNGRKVVVNRK